MSKLRIQSLAFLIAMVLPVFGIFSDSAKAAEVCTGVSGAWFDPTYDGEGFFLLETSTGLAVTFFGYVNSGHRLWLVSEVLPDPIAFDTDFSINMLVGEAGNFQQPSPPSELSVWGSLSLNFTNSNQGFFRLSGIDGDKLSTVVKIAGVKGQVCDVTQCVIDTEGSNRLSFTNDALHGIFDPSLDAEPSSDGTWLSYSTVSPSSLWPEQNPTVINTRLAHSTDGGLNFNFINEINPALDVTLDLAPPKNAGTWVNEVSSIAYDEKADPGKRWKLIWHHYLQIDGNRHFEHGWLGYREAAQADQLKDATEIKLFGAGLYDPINNLADSATHPPVVGAPLIDIRDLNDELSKCSVLSEPGWLSDDDALYLAVGCFQIDPFENQIILLSCAQPCTVTNPLAWRYVNTLLRNNDAQALGFEKFSAPDIFSINGAYYLWVSPVTDSPFADSYNGCRAFQFKSITDGTLHTNTKNQPIPAIILDGIPGTFNGACALHTTAGNKAFYSQLMQSSQDIFQVFRAPTEACFSVISSN